MDVIVLAVIITALVFDFTNGFHDTANAMATSIASGALRPKVAVAISGVLNFVGAFLSVAVAKTISSGLVDDAKITPTVIFGGLIGATWVAAGADAVHFATVVSKVLVPAVLSPIVAGVVAMVGTYLAYRITTRRKDHGRVVRGFQTGQVVSASMVSLAHGTNDGQKTMGIITLTLVTAGMLPSGSAPPFWVILTAGTAIALGTYLGGWRIIRTLGKRVTEIESPQGLSAETSSAAVILVSSQLGFPLSTTQVCTGAIFGAGAGRRLAGVRWGMAWQMAIAWLLTLPAAAVVGAVAGRVADTGTVGTVVVAVAGLAFGGGIYALSRRQPITAHNVNDLPATGPQAAAATV
ncbi:MAG: inorganic phosphate transporter [Pseudonocardiaceae bacterium]